MAEACGSDSNKTLGVVDQHVTEHHTDPGKVPSDVVSPNNAQKIKKIGSEPSTE